MNPDHLPEGEICEDYKMPPPPWEVRWVQGYTIWRPCSTETDRHKWHWTSRGRFEAAHCINGVEEEAFECPASTPDASFPSHPLSSHPTSAVAVQRGTVNDTIAARDGQEMPIDLAADVRGDSIAYICRLSSWLSGGANCQVGSMRYFSAVRTAESVDSKQAFDGVSLVGRAWPPRRTVLISPNSTAGIVIASMVIIEDQDVAENFVLRRVGRQMFGVGGRGLHSGCQLARQGCERSDVEGHGLRLFTADSAAEIQAGCWLGSRSVPTLIVRGDHPGCIEARAGFNGLCEYDGKVAFVRMAGIGPVAWHIFTRANLKAVGGRFVQVASASRAHGPYGAFQPIQIEGYDDGGPGNVYFAAVDNNPLDTETMLGLFPINLGNEGEGNGDGESFIALSLSCDGVNWSSLTKLVWTTGHEGRTWDQPVDGVVLHGSTVHFLVRLAN